MSDRPYEPCDWNPVTNDFAYSDEPSHAEAKYVVGQWGYHLCEACTLLPKFKRMKKKVLHYYLWRKHDE